MYIDIICENLQVSVLQVVDLLQDLVVIVLGQLCVIKCNGIVVFYIDDKIIVVIIKVFFVVEGGIVVVLLCIYDIVCCLIEQVIVIFKCCMLFGGIIYIEEIQDQVELVLMCVGEQKVVCDYVIYCEVCVVECKNVGVVSDVVQLYLSICIICVDGSLLLLDMGCLNIIISEVCEGLVEVDGVLIECEILKNFYDGVVEKDVNIVLVMIVCILVECELNYFYVIVCLLMDILCVEVLGFFGVVESVIYYEMVELYVKVLLVYIEKGVEFELVDVKLKEFDLEKLGKVIDYECDQQFIYFGLQILYDCYFIYKDGICFELLQIFFMCVVMGLVIEEKDCEVCIIEFYNLLLFFDYMSFIFILFNVGILCLQFFSCYLIIVLDDLLGIYGVIYDNVMLLKFVGGLGNDWILVCVLGFYIKGINGKFQGVVFFLKVVNDIVVVVNQGGKCKGVVCVYLEIWYLDIEEFFELCKNIGDDCCCIYDMNIVNWIFDLFMKCVFDDGFWIFFLLFDVFDLYDFYGKVFEECYEYYEVLVSYGKLKLYKVVQVKDLWCKMFFMLFEIGYLWLIFKDLCNLCSLQQYVGVVYSLNFCIEIILNINKDEIVVCNLGLINLVNYIVDGKLDIVKLEKIVKIVVCMFDNVIDINYYLVLQVQNFNFKYCLVGLGIMGFQDVLYLQYIFYGLDVVIVFVDQFMEVISYYVIQVFCDLVDECGVYQIFQGLLWL